MPYIGFDANAWASPRGSLAEPVIWGLSKDSAMTIEILHLTAQIQRWLNARVARHLAAQAERLAR
jgi:hypothetical protein